MYIKGNKRKNRIERKFRNTWIETHTHFHSKQFNKNDLMKETMKRMFGFEGLKKGIIHISENALDRVRYAVTVAITYESNEDIYKLIEKSKYKKHLFFVSGIHPNATSFQDSLDNERYENLRDKYIGNSRCVGIGETGLDYNRISKHKINGDIDWDYIEERASRQTLWFRNSIQLSIDSGKPLVLHIRNAVDQINDLTKDKYQDAYRDAIEVLQEYFGNDNLENRSIEDKTTEEKDVVRGVCHSFNGSRKNLEEMLNLGFYIGVNGMMTRPECEYLRSCIEDCPINRIVVETDSPYLAPFDEKGNRAEKTNTPLSIPLIGQWIADIKGMPVEEVQRITTENALKVFQGIK